MPPDDRLGLISAFVNVAQRLNFKAAAKDLVKAIAGRTIDDALVEETALRIAGLRAGEEAREGIAAFLEKRKPAWRGD